MRLHEEEQLRREADALRAEAAERALFLRRAGRPIPKDAVTRAQRVSPMPALRDTPRVYRDLGDCLALMGLGAFIGALLMFALERVWLP